MKCAKQVILITGASSGIGRATALALSRRSNTLIVTARRRERLETLAEEVRRNGSECRVFPGDGTDEEFCRRVVQETMEEFGRVDIALLNIGIGPPSNSLTASAETIKRCMRVNFDSMINFYVPLMARMKNQETRCLIAHMNSQATYFGIPMQGDYTAAKGACRLFLETARMEMRHFGVRNVVLQTIHPGFVDTEAVRDDGIPAPNEISEEEAARRVIRGLEKELRENLFPRGTKWATKLGRILPRGLLTRILLAGTPERY